MFLKQTIKLNIIFWSIFYWEFMERQLCPEEITNIEECLGREKIVRPILPFVINKLHYDMSSRRKVH